MSHVDEPTLLALSIVILWEGERQKQAATRRQIAVAARRRRRRARRCWVRPFLLRRATHGHYVSLVQELQLHDRSTFKNFLRVTPDMFFEILERIEERITKKKTNYREPLDPGLKLALTLRYMATGDSYMSFSYSFLVSQPAIS